MPGRLMHSQSRSSSRRDNTMANLLLAVTVLALLAGCVAGAIIPAPGFSFAYTQADGGTISQSYSGPSDSQVYGYHYKFPGQKHSEKKTNDGQVRGDYAFTDANGDLQQVKYRVAPGDGFEVVEAAVARSGAVPSVVPAQDVNSDPAFAAEHPQLVASVRSGELGPFRLVDGQLVSRVSDKFRKESVSATAHHFGVDLVAARHDQQVRSHPNMPYDARQAETNNGVLEQAELPDGSIFYVVRVTPNF